MTPVAFLKLALHHRCHEELAWLSRLFCEVTESVPEVLSPFFPFRDGKHTYFFDLDQKKTQILGADVPLFRPRDILEIDETWFTNVSGLVKTCVGNVLFNAIAVADYFPNQIPFIVGKISIRDLEKKIVALLESVPKDPASRDPAKIYVDTYLDHRDALFYLEELAPFVSIAATEKGITQAEGLEEFKAQLVKEYGERLKDPLVFSEFEDRLKAFDREWLKDDPSLGGFLSGKVLDVSRKRCFITQGFPEQLDDEKPATPIIESLKNGQPKDPKDYVASLNHARHGSLSRGLETQNGGVVAKAMIRAGSAFVIDTKDCKTQRGIRRWVTAENAPLLVNRTLVVKGQSFPVTSLESAQRFVGTQVIVRSPAYCEQKPGDAHCEVCVGPQMGRFKEGTIISTTEVSSIFLTQSLKAMHGKTRKVATIDLESVVS